VTARARGSPRACIEGEVGRRTAGGIPLASSAAIARLRTVAPI
jgi:hypothetical protein